MGVGGSGLNFDQKTPSVKIADRPPIFDFFIVSLS